MTKKTDAKTIIWFADTDRNDLPRVGGKAANLGELAKMGAPVPDGFTVTAQAYFEFLKHGSLVEKIKKELKDLDVEDNAALEQATEAVRTHILASETPPEITAEITRAYRTLSGAKDILVAVRSSATAEDLPEASFAGQQETYLNIKGTTEVLKAVKSAWASLFTPRATFYRKTNGFDHLKVGLAVPIQRMVSAEVSGVMFTVEPLTNNREQLTIEAVFGLGEGLVQGSFVPDRYAVDKKNLKIVERTIANQPFQIGPTGEIPVSKPYQNVQKIPDKIIKEVAEWGKKIEDHYQFPQDIEWVFSRNKVWIVQTRPVTTLDESIESASQIPVSESFDETLLLTGVGASPGQASGKVQILKSAKELDKIKAGDILVTEMTNPDFVPAMQRAVAIVTDKGGRTSHAAIVSRELGIPCVVGAVNATTMLKNGEIITVVGDEGKVYSGEHQLQAISKVNVEKNTPEELQKTATKVYVNLSEPDLAEKTAKLNADGVGLFRAEFMFAKIGMHPQALIKKKKTNKLTDQLQEGLQAMAKAFAPRPVVYRTNDFKTSEYRNLTGGEEFEAVEANPMIGFRGASRYITEPEVFLAELEAIKKVRRYYKNLWVMIPFVRTPEELIAVKKIMGEAGLFRNSSFKLWLMVEIPSNVILLEKFIGVGIDGISIGSNDLTQLTLGIDRDNEKLQASFDERNEAVLCLIEQAIKTASAHGITSSICGQAPSSYPEFCQKLVQWGITSISVSPDAVDSTRKIIIEAEKRTLGLH